MDMVDMVTDMTGLDIERWLKTQYQNCVPLQWFGKGADRNGLTGKADPEMARQVLCDGITPNGDNLVTITAVTCERSDGVTFLAQPTVGYLVRFFPHKTSVRALLADPEAREAVLEAHQAAVEAALAVLEEETNIWLAGVVATIYDGPRAYRQWPKRKQPVFASEAVFAASWRQWLLGSTWYPLGTVHDALTVIFPVVWKAYVSYQRRLGEEVESRLLGVEVAYEAIPDTGLPIAVVKS